ncbi:hypothetical protein ACIPY5_07865 [Microbacterium sp. NPDC089698]|uniref:hypothetical protein n=1 Tax=Microbacterium sp. NPDC089698 TaxID=3364200 RepID=UPI00380C0CC5
MTESTETASADLTTLHSALATEQMVLQSVATATIGEAGGRSTIYLSTLSSGLVALGFSASTPGLLATLTFTLLPTIFMLGWFTVVRLVDNTVENIAVRHRMENIRAHFAGLHPSGPALLVSGDARTGEYGVRYGRSSFLFTMASMVAAVNCVLGGALIALALSVGLGLPALSAQLAGAAVGFALLVATLAYERRRIRGASLPHGPVGR